MSMEPTMKRSTLILLTIGFFVSMNAYAEDANAPAAPAATETAAAPAAPAVTPVAAPEATPAAAPSVPAVAPAAVPAAATDENSNLDNLEFISGEVGALDEAGKTLTVKLYGETETTATDKTLKVSVDTSTDITDGEQDRDFKSLAVGTEVDVEYDPATNKATYIFVY